LSLLLDVRELRTRHYIQRSTFSDCIGHIHGEARVCEGRTYMEGCTNGLA